MALMHGIFTNALWYLEFFAFTVILILFIVFVLHLAELNSFAYNPRHDMRKKTKLVKTKPKRRVREPPQRPVCFDLGCIWFCRLTGSLVTLGLCYYCAYALISSTKLKFGLFMP